MLLFDWVNNMEENLKGRAARAKSASFSFKDQLLHGEKLSVIARLGYISLEATVVQELHL
jgi:hypothetical protein